MSQNMKEIVWEPHTSYSHGTNTAEYIAPTDQVHLHHGTDELYQRELGPQGSINQAVAALNQPINIEHQWISSNPEPIGKNLHSVQLETDNDSSQNRILNQSPSNSEINQTSAQGNNHVLSSSFQPDKTSKSINDCENCITNNRDRHPFDKISICNKCQCQWANFLSSSINVDSDNSSVTQMLYDRHIRLTRTMAQELIDDYGFGPNIHGYRRHRPVKMIFPLDRTKSECIGVLCRVHQGKVKVWIPELRMVEWLPVGTRRIKLMNPQEEKDAETMIKGSNPSIDDVELLPDKQDQQASKVSHNKRASLDPARLKEPSKIQWKQRKLTEPNTVDSQMNSTQATSNGAYLNTGAFATRRAVHQLKDDNGFIPNPFGYARNQAVEILDTKHSKSKSWYDGTLVEMKPGYIKVHYNQWPETYDEWLMIGSRRIRIADGGNVAKEDMCRSDEHLMVLAEDPDAQHEAKRKRRSVGMQQKRQKSMNSRPEQSSTRPITSNRVAHLKAAEAEQFVPNVYGYYYMQHVTVLHCDKRHYEARIVGIQKNKVKIHYCGWADEFDELIPNDSKRLQAIDTTNQVECIEPDYSERDREAPLITDSNATDNEVLGSIDVFQEKEAKEIINLNASEHGTEMEEHTIIVDDVTVDNAVVACTSKVYCSHCKKDLEQFRYYCTYCEASSSKSDQTNLKSFQLCLACFDHCFPDWHQHPRSGFAIEAITDSPNQLQNNDTSSSSSIWEEDILDCIDETALSLEASKIFTDVDNTAIQDEYGYLLLQKWKDRKICAFCNDDDDNWQELGPFVGPFVSITTKLGQEKKRTFWVHEACAKYSPEVRYSAVDGKWYNVTRALKRGRSMRCFVCKEKGATIGCFDSKCSKSFHLACTNKPINNFRNGVIFWCHVHEAAHNKKDTYINIFHCDGCSKRFSKDETWLTCEQCSLVNYFSSFDICDECYNDDAVIGEHQHDKSAYQETSYSLIEQLEACKQIKKEEAVKKAQLFPRRTRKLPSRSTTTTSCCYCGTLEADTWRKGYDGGILMCNTCFGMVYNKDRPAEGACEGPLAIESYVASIEDYSHKPYLTRDTVSSSNKPFIGPRLTSYEPQSNQLFSLTFDSTYFDIPGRAPRWATHSGTDYHGTWLPQTVRRALLKYTKQNERILSNFLGRGTDAIECFLLQRKCCGIDINPAAVALSQRNCCFEVPAGLTFAEYRPIIALADARQLKGSLFGDESYDHILSHPPYKDCVAYSTHLEGDLSRFTQLNDFKAEYTRVIRESYRVLKMDRRLTLGIGDNREHCFYVPVGFHLIRLYIDQGFELEELIVKRQRYCSAFGLGTYLCVQFDFLVFTHEFIATFRKIPQQEVNRMPLVQDAEDSDTANKPIYAATLYGIPQSAITRKSRVMGTVWTFNLSHQYSFQLLCISRMIERFGQDDCNWLLVKLAIDKTTQEHHQQQQRSEPRANRLSITAISSVPEVETVSEYEQERQRKIQENKETLLKLGLISDLSQDSVVNDSIYCDTLLNKKPHAHADLVVMATGHIENLLPSQIDLYRKSIIQLVQDAMSQLAVKGMLIIGTKDIRDQTSGKLWPISMLVLEDVERTSNGLKLKEMVITVPEGYSKNKDTFTTESPIEEEPSQHLPIVHAIYLIFQKQ